MAAVRKALTPALCVALCAALLQGQSSGTAAGSALERAMEFEGRLQYRDAVREYRLALGKSDDFAVALLGLERSYHELGLVDSMLPVIDSVLMTRPSDGVARSVQMRSLRTLGLSTQLRQAFESWRAAAPNEASPYREYARLLIDDGKSALADSILRDAEASLSNARVLSMEFARVRAALGQWDVAALAWRHAVEDADYLERAAVFALSAAPVDMRDTIRKMMGTPPRSVAVSKTLSQLELGWGSPRLAWEALRNLPANDSTRVVWLSFADDAESRNGWLAARDALLAADGARHEVELISRAARFSATGGDSQMALQLVERGEKGLAQEEAARLFGITHVRALADLQRPAEAESLAAGLRSFLGKELAALAGREVAWGWVRAGDVERARRAIAADSAYGEVEDMGGWLSLYAGDLQSARVMLRGYGETNRIPGTLTAMAVLGRTRQDSSKALGSAFLALARGDSAGSALFFRESAEGLPDAASLLLSSAARIVLSSDTASAVALWKEIIEQHGESPEAAEADLEWARVLVARGDRDGAITRLEHLILSYPTSALVPQGRRELDRLRGVVPPQEKLYEQ